MRGSVFSPRRVLTVALPLIAGVPVSSDSTFPIPYSSTTFARDCVGRESERLFVLTFDDGPALSTEPILDVLAEENATATFFAIGSNFDRFPGNRYRYEKLVRRAVREGHTIANHGMDNDEFTLSDVLACQAQISLVTNGYETQYFRPAQGAYTVAKHDALVEAGYYMIMWNVDPTDWMDHNPGDILEFVRSAVAEPTAPVGSEDPANHEVPRRGSFIMLAHDNKDIWTRPVGGGTTLLAATIRTIRGAGYRIVSLDECLGLNGTDFDVSRLDAIDDTGLCGPSEHDATSYCGKFWEDAQTCRRGSCPCGVTSECPSGMLCFSGIQCRGDDGGGGREADGGSGIDGGMEGNGDGGGGEGEGQDHGYTREEIMEWGRSSAARSWVRWTHLLPFALLAV